MNPQYSDASPGAASVARDPRDVTRRCNSSNTTVSRRTVAPSRCLAKQTHRLDADWWLFRPLGRGRSGALDGVRRDRALAA
jgi:hypothetical protein